jgi:SEC-C motif domain protein
VLHEATTLVGNVQECCQIYHKGGLEPTPEAVMRARFSAYRKGLVRYIMQTTHPDNPATQGSKTPDGKQSSTFEQDIRATCDKVEFVNLAIIDRSTSASGDEGHVRFIVKFKVIKQLGSRQHGDVVQTMTEDGAFKMVNGRWLYLTGKTTYK